MPARFGAITASDWMKRRDMSKPKMQFRVLGAVLGAAAAFAGQRVATAGWHTVTGEEPPDPSDPTVSPVKAYAWSIGSTLLLGTLALLVQRFVATRSSAAATSSGPGNPSGHDSGRTNQGSCAHCSLAGWTSGGIGGQAARGLIAQTQSTQYILPPRVSASWLRDFTRKQPAQVNSSA